jgi:hypothetical protein
LTTPHREHQQAVYYFRTIATTASQCGPVSDRRAIRNFWIGWSGMMTATWVQDTLVPVSPSAKLTLAPDLQAWFPAGYRHLTYIQTRIGYKVKPHIPGLTVPDFEKPYAKGWDWLAGGNL